MIRVFMMKIDFLTITNKEARFNSFSKSDRDHLFR